MSDDQDAVIFTYEGAIGMPSTLRVKVGFNGNPHGYVDIGVTDPGGDTEVGVLVHHSEIDALCDALQRAKAGSLERARAACRRPG